MHTQATGELGQIWRRIGHIEGNTAASFIAIRRELNQVRRDMRDIKAKTGRPLWMQFSTMALIATLSILGIINPELAKAIVLKLVFKMVTG